MAFKQIFALSARRYICQNEVQAFYSYGSGTTPRKIVPQSTDSGSAEPSFGVLAMADHPKASGATHDLLSIKDLHPRPAPFPGAPMANFHALKVSFPGFLTNSSLPPQGRKRSFEHAPTEYLVLCSDRRISRLIQALSGMS